jgi:hypothetical protein
VTECKNDFEYVCEEEAPKPLDSYGVPAADPSDNLFNSKKIKIKVVSANGFDFLINLNELDL